MNADFNLFNAMHGGLVNLSQSAFEQSLVLNVLFQERVVVWDGSIFTCQRLLDHLKSRKSYPSMFEVACKRGLVIPAFHDSTIKCLRDSSDANRKFSPGYELEAFGPYRESVIAAIDEGIGSGTSRPLYWPANAPPSSVGYERIVRNLLQRENPPEYVHHDPERAQRFDRTWKTTERWRTELIDQAVDRTAKEGRAGLRQQQVYNALGAYLGVSLDTPDVNYNQLLSACTTPSDHSAMVVFLRWLAQCHFMSQAKGLEVSVNFPVYNYDEDFALESLLTSRLDAAPSKQEGIRCEVSLPSIADLARADPRDLMAMRSDLGSGYLSALKRWQTEPNDQRLETLTTSLQQYCTQISARYQDIRPTAVDVKIGNRHVDNIVQAGMALGLAAGAAAYPNAESIAALSLICILTKIGFASYNLLAESFNKNSNLPIKQDIEITLPTPAL